MPPRARYSVGLTYNIKKNVKTDPPDAEAEYDDIGTVMSIKGALEESGCAVTLFEADGRLTERLLAGRPDIVFNIAEGSAGRGREAQVPAILSYFGIPFAGSDETAMCVTLIKSLAKTILSAHKIRTPKFKVFMPGEPVTARGLPFPAFVKPDAEGSGKGITALSVARNARELRSAVTAAAEIYKQNILAEAFVEGREFTVGLLGNGGETRVFEPMEIVFKAGGPNIYSYEVKQNFRDYVEYKCPPDISGEMSDGIKSAALSIYDILECRDFARIDFRMDRSGALFFIEINPLPGLAPGYSDYPMLAQFNGVGYNELIRAMLNAALARYGMRKI